MAVAAFARKILAYIKRRKSHFHAVCRRWSPFR